MNPTNPDVYIPTSCIPLSANTTEQQIRLGLQGEPKVGKTFAALTFPNPIVLNLDRGLGAHAGRDGVHEVPMWDAGFADKIIPRSGVACPPNRRDAIKKWLMTDGQKLTANQTLVFDGGTSLQQAFDSQQRLEPVYTKGGKIDDFAFWKLKVEYFGEIMDLLKSLKSHVVYIAHETPDRDDTGALNGKVRPLLTGQFGDQLASHFTDWFRHLAFAKPSDDAKLAKFKTFFKLDDAQAKEWIASSPTDSIYVWQTQADELAKCGTSTLVGAPKYILANYNSFAKYKRNQNK